MLPYVIGFSLASSAAGFSQVFSNLQNNIIGFVPWFITVMYSFFAMEKSFRFGTFCSVVLAD